VSLAGLEKGSQLLQGLPGACFIVFRPDAGRQTLAQDRDLGAEAPEVPEELGPERPLLLSHADKERIAYHEGGHAILGLVVPGADPVHRVTIVPRGHALGVTYQRPDSDRYNYPEAYLRARIVGMLGGRAAEEIVYGTKTTGAESDIEQATDLARRMVTRWGMSERLGLVQLAPRENPYLSGSDGYGGSRPFSEVLLSSGQRGVLAGF